MCLPPPRVSDKSGFISQTRQWGFVSYLKMQRVLKDFTLKSLVSVKFFQNCWWLNLLFRRYTIGVFWSVSVSCIRKLTAQKYPPTFPYGRTHAMVTVLDGGGKFSLHVSWEQKKFVLSVSSPPSSHQWHWKGKEKTKHKLRERRRGFQWKSSLCSPLLALALLAEGLPGFYLISASELEVLRVTWQSYWCGQCVSVTGFLEATEKQK